MRNKPTISPTFFPSTLPSIPTQKPITLTPTYLPTTIPSNPTLVPTFVPSTPTVIPTSSPTRTPGWSFVNLPETVLNPILMTDGSIMLIGYMSSPSSNVYKLTPDSYGNYQTGTVTQLASLPTGYCPLYFASATLADGRIIIEGGEYNCGPATWSNLGAIYDPVTNVWTSITLPSFATKIGDASCAVLPDGTFLLQDFFNW